MKTVELLEAEIDFPKIKLQKMQDDDLIIVTPDEKLAVQLLQRFEVCNQKQHQASDTMINNTLYFVRKFGGEVLVWSKAKNALVNYIQRVRPNTTDENALVEAGAALGKLRRSGVLAPVFTKK